MHSLRHFILIAALIVAQWAIERHVVEHAVGKDGSLPAHVCELCLAAHDLDFALPGVISLPPIMDMVPVPGLLLSFSRNYLPPPRASQRAPPIIRL